MHPVLRSELDTDSLVNTAVSVEVFEQGETSCRLRRFFGCTEWRQLLVISCEDHFARSRKRNTRGGACRLCRLVEDEHIELSLEGRCAAVRGCDDIGQPIAGGILGANDFIR